MQPVAIAKRKDKFAHNYLRTHIFRPHTRHNCGTFLWGKRVHQLQYSLSTRAMRVCQFTRLAMFYVSVGGEYLNVGSSVRSEGRQFSGSILRTSLRPPTPTSKLAGNSGPSAERNPP
jgi:hypothetical protein